MTGLAAQYNTGINNDSHVIRIILEDTFPSDLNTIIDQEYLLETIIKNCLVNANSKGTDIKYNEWKSEFLKDTSITLVLSENGHSSLLQLKDDLLTLRAINKKIKRINQNFKEKIISDLSVDGTNDWAHFVNWLENTHKPYIEKPNIKNNTLKEALTAWLTENKEVQLSYLEKNVKDFLHSEAQ